MAYLNFDEAVQKVMREKDADGAHIFYYGRLGVFEIRGDSRNGAYAGDKITTNINDYFGWIRDQQAKDGKQASWTVNNVVDELLSAIEYQKAYYKGVTVSDNPHNFSLTNDSTMYANVQRIAYLGHKDVDN